MTLRNLNNKCIYPLLYAASIAIATAQCTNSIFGTNCRSMARKNLTDLIRGSAQTYPVQPHPLGNTKPQQQQRPTKYFNNSTTSKYFKAITPPPVVGSEQQQQPPLPRFYSQGKTSPTGTPKQGSPRTSPGLLARHYAGCKFSEPPAPAMLPLPPQHWTLTQSSAYIMAPTDGTAHLFALSHQQQCLTQQLKVLLKVQA